MVTVLTRAAHRPAMLARRPELMVADADDGVLVDEVLTKASTLIVGPGLGRAGWGERLLEQALARALPTVIDADGLQLLARHGVGLEGPTLLTPHVAEAAVLLGCSVSDVQADRCAAALELAKRAGEAGAGAAVLKGAGSVMACAGEEGERLLGVCAHGNPGMASAGMGDVLAGVLGGLLAQRPDVAATLAVGVCAHSAAADTAAGRVGERGLLATDLLEPLLTLTSHR
jgi:NAD(P)H-hydrate epimerase